MIESWSRTLHFSSTLFYLLGIGGLLVVALALGLILRRLLNNYSKEFSDSWRALALRLLASLPTPLLILVALYAGLQMLPLPGRYGSMGSQLISVLIVAVLFLFPAKVIVALLERLGHKNYGLERATRFAALMTRALSVLLAAYTMLEVLGLPPQYERLGSRVVAALGILLVFYALARIAILYLSRLNEKDPDLQRVTEPAGFVVRVLFALLAVIILLENLGIHLTALWTTLGLGSVSVALALQETLGNFFSGIYLLADRPINAGDYIKLDSGHEGYVAHVGWRSTSIRTLGNNIVIVPNATVSKAVITNYSRPENRMSLDIRVSTAYGEDPRRVEKILVEVAQEAARDKTEGLLSFPEPSAKLIPGFGQLALDFTLGVQVRKFVDQYQVQSELRKRILERFQTEGIKIPVATQAWVLEKIVSDPPNGHQANSLRSPPTNPRA